VISFKGFFVSLGKLTTMNRILSVFSIALIILMSSCQQGEKKITIGYVQISPDPVLDAARDGVFKALRDSGFIDGQKIKILEKNAQSDLSMITMILQSFQSQNVDMVITNGTPCMNAAAQTIKGIPVVFTVAFSPEQIGLKNPPATLTGIFDELRVKEIVDLMLECKPGIKRIGFPYNNAEPNAEYSAKMLDKEFAARGIEVIHATVNSTNDILQSTQYLIGKQIDALVAAADNTVYLGLNALTKIAAEHKIPVFVTDPMQVDKGAAVGIGADYSDWGYQSGLKAVEILRGKKPSETPIAAMKKYQIAINQKAAAAQGLVIPQSVVARADKIVQ